ncbi:hypothetical protein M2140_001787 [Clostridiales Family XIII bacterium PM5-7]
MQLKKRNEKKERKPEKEKREKKVAIKDEADLFGIRYYDEMAEGYVLEDGSYLDYFEIKSNDIDNSFVDEVQYDMLRLAKFFKLYRDDVKIIGMNFPVTTRKQRMFLERKKETTNSPVRKKWLERSISELAKQDLNNTKREFYLMYFSKDQDAHLKNQKQILNILGTGKNGLLDVLSVTKKNQILFTMNNQSTLMLVEEEYDEYE